MRHIPLRNKIVLSLFLCFVIEASTACGGSSAIKSFRIALASAGPLVSSLAASGAIPESRTTAIIADFDAGARCGFTLQEDFDAIPKEATDARARKLAASQKSFQCFRVIIDRQNFAAHPRLQQVAGIADGVLASLVIFYSDGAADSGASSAAMKATIVAKTETDLERQMSAQMKALERLMQP